MSLTVQSVSNDSYIDTRQVIGLSSADLTKFTSWVDRIHKDVLHSSVYSYLNIFTTSFTTAPGIGSYTLTPINIRRIKGVFDFSKQRILFPIERATSPVSQVEQQEPNPGQQGSSPQTFGMPATSPISLQAGQPAYFRHIGAQQLNLYPVPGTSAGGGVFQINVSYEMQVPTLVNPTDILLVPEDARDMIVAGVNYLANVYLKRSEEAQMWAQIYTKLKLGESLI